MIKTFKLVRLEDATGISGTGVVAFGAQLPSGKCVLEWREPYKSIGLYDDLTTLVAVHGHNGMTVVEWDSEIDQLLTDDTNRALREVFDLLTPYKDENVDIATARNLVLAKIRK